MAERCQCLSPGPQGQRVILDWSRGAWLLMAVPAESPGDGRLTPPTVSPQGLLRRHGALWQHIQLLQGQLHLLLRHLPLPLLLWAPEEPAGPGFVQQLQVPRMGSVPGPRHCACGQQARPRLRDAAAAEQQVRVWPLRVKSREALLIKENQPDLLLYFWGFLSWWKERHWFFLWRSFLLLHHRCTVECNNAAVSHYDNWVDKSTVTLLTWIRETARKKKICIANFKILYVSDKWIHSVAIYRFCMAACTKSATQRWFLLNKF